MSAHDLCIGTRRANGQGGHATPSSGTLQRLAQYKAVGTATKRTRCVQTGAVDQQRYRDLSSELTSFLPQLSEDILASPAVKWALEVSRAVRQSNCAAFFRLLRQATYIQSCICHLIFIEVRHERLLQTTLAVNAAHQ